MRIYYKLYRAYGPRHWWPGETHFEVMTGAILTQNTSWRTLGKKIPRCDICPSKGVRDERQA
jgi:endonuclease-3 related protein